MSFYRLKQRGTDTVYLEYDGAQADVSAGLREAEPDQLVAFLKVD